MERFFKTIALGELPKIPRKYEKEREKGKVWGTAH
jgi:hypothetical protein